MVCQTISTVCAWIRVRLNFRSALTCLEKVRENIRGVYPEINFKTPFSGPTTKLNCFLEESCRRNFLLVRPWSHYLIDRVVDFYCEIRSRCTLEFVIFWRWANIPYRNCVSPRGQDHSNSTMYYSVLILIKTITSYNYLFQPFYVHRFVCIYGCANLSCALSVIQSYSNVIHYIPCVLV